LLANLVWGKLVPKKVNGVEELQWTYVSDQLTEIRPVLEDSQDEVMSFKEYLDRILPLKTAEEVPDAKERAHLNAENELQRNTRLLNFSRPGNPGAKFKGPFEKMIKAITLPKGVKEELNILDDNVGDAYILQN
jgi:hypothetical protein